MSAVAGNPPQQENSIWDMGRSHQQISGKLVHPNGDPRSAQKVKAYAKIWFLKFHIGTFTTNKNGEFHFNYKWWVLPFISTQTILFRVFEEKVFCSHEGLKKAHERLVYETEIETQPDMLNKDVGNVTVKLYEYENDLPDIKLPDDEEMRPQHWPYQKALLKAAFDEQIKDALVGKLHGPLTIEKVEKIYGVGDPTLDVCPETTIEMLLNGIFPCPFKKGVNENELVVDTNWDKYEKDVSPQLPNTRLTLSNKDGKLDVETVTFQIQGHSALTVGKNSPDFKRALRLFNCSAIVKGELTSHLGTHLWIGQIAMAVFRSLNLNPLKALLAPHLRGVLEINRMGRTAIFGPDGILNVSGLTTKGIRDYLKDHLGSMCYTTFKPKKPLNEEHRYAIAGQLFWDVVTETVDAFFAEHEEGVKEHWNEIFYLSKNLVNHSVPYVPFDGEEDYNAWADGGEIDDPSAPGRVVYKEKIRSMRPITLNPNAPEASAIDKLKQLSYVTLYRAIWGHDPVHKSQKKWVTNMRFGSLAPDNSGHGPYGGVSVENAQRQLSITHTLTDFDEGALLDNSFGDIYPLFIEKLKAHQAEFDKLGYDITKLTYGIII